MTLPFNVLAIAVEAGVFATNGEGEMGAAVLEAWVGDFATVCVAGTGDGRVVGVFDRALCVGDDVNVTRAVAVGSEVGGFVIVAGATGAVQAARKSVPSTSTRAMFFIV